MFPLFRELDHRTNDGIDVRMLWSPQDDHVVVVVTDTKTDDCFEVEVREGESAMDVFRHPYAYAAWRGIETRTFGLPQAA